LTYNTRPHINRFLNTIPHAISSFLFQIASALVHWLWSKAIDPDNAAIPYLTSLGDLLGGALLAGAFHLFYSVHAADPTAADPITEQLQNQTLA
jgi:solute carrier family 41